jgi:hypothetical protein
VENKSPGLRPGFFMRYDRIRDQSVNVIYRRNMRLL